MIPIIFTRRFIQVKFVLMMKKGRALFLMLLLVLGWGWGWGCAERRPRGQEGTGSPGFSPGESLPPPFMFPHAEGWTSPSSHGVWVVQYGIEPCLKCHKAGTGKEESPPTCQSCHPLYPHEGDWVKKEKHGEKVLTEGKAGCATQCHGYDLAGGLSGVSCNACHTIYPHGSGWSAPAAHGEYDKGICRACHGADLLGGASGVSCKKCHENYPHVSDWLSAHRGIVIEKGKETCATQCHGLDLKGGLSGISCNACHSIYPHSDFWATDHGSAAISLGKNVCSNCHGGDFKTVLDGKNCYSCHADYPHPAPAVWNTFAGHGQTVKTVYGGNTAACETCHGADLKAMKNGKNCFSCHASYPHSKVTTADWKGYEGGHGEYALLHTKTECRVCHGTDYQGGSRGNPSCFSCHVSYPHLEGWRRSAGEPQEHGNYVNANTSASCATARCHGDLLIPTPGVTKGPDCKSCHAAYPHPAGWVSGPSPTLHGPAAKANIAACKSCHTSTLDYAPSGRQTCKECHPVLLKHVLAGQPDRWVSEADHGTYLKGKGWDLSECQLCHGADYLGGVSMKSCKSCHDHESYPHNLPDWKTTYAGHGQFVLVTLGHNKTSCKLCHGSDLKGGHSEKSCYTCHTNYPHGIDWVLGINHGPSAAGPLKVNCSSSNCHGADFMGRPPPAPSQPPLVPSCYSCHDEYPPTDPNWRRIRPRRPP